MTKHRNEINAPKATPFQPLEELLFPRGYKLLIGTSQIYELELAVAETRALTSTEIISRGAYFASVQGQETNHVKLCGVTPVQVDTSSSARRKNFFAANIFKTGYATHGLFPYGMEIAVFGKHWLIDTVAPGDVGKEESGIEVRDLAPVFTFTGIKLPADWAKPIYVMLTGKVF